MKNGLRLFLSVGALCLAYGVHVPLALAWDPLTGAGANLIGWYDASVSNNVVTTGTSVTNWKDIIGNGLQRTGGAPSDALPTAIIIAFLIVGLENDLHVKPILLADDEKVNRSDKK